MMGSVYYKVGTGFIEGLDPHQSYGITEGDWSLQILSNCQKWFPVSKSRDISYDVFLIIVIHYVPKVWNKLFISHIKDILKNFSGKSTLISK